MGNVGTLLPIIELAAVGFLAARFGCRRHPILLAYLTVNAAAQTAVLAVPGSYYATQPILLVVRAMLAAEFCLTRNYVGLSGVALQSAIPFLGGMFLRGGIGWTLLPFATRSGVNTVLWLVAYVAVLVILASVVRPAMARRAVEYSARVVELPRHEFSGLRRRCA